MLQLSNNKRIQQEQQSGHTKLTAVTIGHGQRKKQFFVHLKHNEKGEAILPTRVLDKLLDEMNIMHGQAYTVS